MPRGWRQGELGGLAFIAVGLTLVMLTVGGYFVGALIDRALGTRPIGAIVGLLLGFIIGIWDLYVVAMRLMNRMPSLPHVAQNIEEEQEGGRDEYHE